MIKRRLTLGQTTINYELKVNQRARRLILTWHPTGRLVVTVPKLKISQRQIDQLLRAKADWLIKQQQKFLKFKPLLKSSRIDYLKYQASARSLVLSKLQHFNQLYRFHYGRVAIKNQRTRWGSCSAKKNLNFNYRLIFLPTKLVDYLIVHELCHLAELNHSPKFWQLVAQTMPDYQLRKKELKLFNLRLN